MCCVPPFVVQAFWSKSRCTYPHEKQNKCCVSMFLVTTVGDTSPFSIPSHWKLTWSRPMRSRPKKKDRRGMCMESKTVHGQTQSYVTIFTLWAQIQIHPGQLFLLSMSPRHVCMFVVLEQTRFCHVPKRISVHGAETYTIHQRKKPRRTKAGPKALVPCSTMSLLPWSLHPIALVSCLTRTKQCSEQRKEKKLHGDNTMESAKQNIKNHGNSDSHQAQDPSRINSVLCSVEYLQLFNTSGYD